MWNIYSYVQEVDVAYWVVGCSHASNITRFLSATALKNKLTDTSLSTILNEFFIITIITITVVAAVTVVAVVIVGIAGNRMSARANTGRSCGFVASSWNYPRAWIQSLGETSAAAHGADARAAWCWEHKPTGVHKMLEAGTARATRRRAEAGAEKRQSECCVILVCAH